MSHNAAWPTASTPGGQVMTDHGAVPGCVRGTCTHARLAHDGILIFVPPHAIYQIEVPPVERTPS